MALLATLQDGFQDNQRNPALWNIGTWNLTPAGASVAETGGQVVITLLPSTGGNNYSGYISAATYDGTNSEAVVKLVGHTGSGTSAEARFVLSSDASNAWYFVIGGGGNIQARRMYGGSSATISGTTYSPSTHAWLKLAVNSSGECSYYTAPSTASDPPAPGDWTLFAGPIAPSTIVPTALNASIYGGTYESVGSPGVVTFDGFNVATTSTVGDTAANDGSYSITESLYF